MIDLHQGNSAKVLQGVESNTVDLVCTDPPYGLAFMGKNWDRALPDVEIWRQCLRVLKPGAFAFVMCTPRQDCLARMIIALEDAGFWIGFTSIYWAFGQGFPKAANLKKQLDKRYETSESQMCDVWEALIREAERIETDNNRRNLQTMLADLEQRKQHQIHAHAGSKSQKFSFSIRSEKPCLERRRNLPSGQRQLWNCEICSLPTALYFDGPQRWVCYGAQACNGKTSWAVTFPDGSCASYQSSSNRQSDSKSRIICEQCRAQKSREVDGSYGGWQGKPAVEPVLVAMKPCNEKTWLDQALSNGKGCTWLDRARIPTSEPRVKLKNIGRSGDGITGYDLGSRSSDGTTTQGRFPANLIIEDSAVEDGRERPTGDVKPHERENPTFCGGQFAKKVIGTYQGDTGGFSRYFDLDAWFRNRIPDLRKTFPFLLCPKASASEKSSGLHTERDQMDPIRAEGFENPYNRGGVKRRNNHPTCKPLKLMSWLIELGSQKGDLVLDPFLGSGTTALACKALDRDCIGIELSEEYLAMAKEHIEQTAVQGRLF